MMRGKSKAIRKAPATAGRINAQAGGTMAAAGKTPPAATPAPTRTMQQLRAMPMGREAGARARDVRAMHGALGARRTAQLMRAGGGQSDDAMAQRVMRMGGAEPDEALRVQPKLEVGPPNDAYEREADATAQRVMRMGGGACCPSCAEGKECEVHPARIRRMAGDADAGMPVPSDLEPRIQKMQRGGEPLPDQIRTQMEPRFGQDFSDVRIHRDAEAANTAQALGAKAYTLGNHIAFNTGQYAPGTPSGDHLMGHELTHVAQGDEVTARRSLFDWLTGLVSGDDEEETVSEAAEEMSTPTDDASDEYDPYTDEVADPTYQISRDVAYLSDSELADEIERVEEELSYSLTPEEEIDLVAYRDQLKDEEYLRHLIYIDDFRLFLMEEDQVSAALEVLEAAQERPRPDAEDITEAITRFQAQELDPAPEAPAVASGAFKGISSYNWITALMLPEAERVASGSVLRRGEYTLAPHARVRSDGSLEVLYYLAYRRGPDQFEYVVGPDSLHEFLSRQEEFQEEADAPGRQKVARLIGKLNEGDWDVDDEAAKLTDHEMRMITAVDRIRLIAHIGEGFFVGDEDEATLVRLMATTPREDAGTLITALRRDESALLQTLESAIDGEEYKQYHSVLRANFFGSLGPGEAAAQMESAIELPWADPGLIGSMLNERFYYEDFSFTDSGKLSIDMWHNIGPLGIKRLDDYEVEPFQMIKVRFYYDEPEIGIFKHEIKHMPAINLMQLVNKQFRQELATVADVALLAAGGLGVFSAGSKVARAVAALDLLVSASDVAIREFRSEIAGLPGGAEFLEAWDSVQTLIMFYAAGRVILEVPSGFRKLRDTYQRFRGSSGAQLSKKAARDLENSVEGMLDEADRARRELTGEAVPSTSGPRGSVSPASGGAAAARRALSRSDDALVSRAKELHRELAIAELQSRGRKVTEDAIKRTLGQGTVSITEAILQDRIVSIVNTNRSQFQTLLDKNTSKFLKDGEHLGSRITYVYPEKGSRISVHAEQLGVNDAAKLGATEGRVASSNPGCEALCLSLLSESFPGFEHVNPAN